MTTKLLETTSLNKLYDDFDWDEIPFDKTAEFVEMMGDRIIGVENTQGKSLKRIPCCSNEILP